MANPFTPEHNRLVFQSLYFMSQVYEVMQEAAEDDEDTVEDYWDVEIDKDEGGPAAYVVIDARRKAKKDSFLDVTRWFPQPGCEQTLPLYVNVLREDEQDLWEELKREFPEATVLEDDMTLGFEWPLPADASNDQVREAGRSFGRRLAKVIWGE